MTTFEALLSGEAPAGVYVWPAAPDDAAALAAAEGWAAGTVGRVLPATKSGLTPNTELKSRLLAAIAEALRFPEHFGGNLDALADCLRDVATPTLLVWDAWALPAMAIPDTFATIVEVLRRRAAETTGAPAFAVVLSGAGPEVDLPRLD